MYGDILLILRCVIVDIDTIVSIFMFYVCRDVLRRCFFFNSSFYVIICYVHLEIKEFLQYDR